MPFARIATQRIAAPKRGRFRPRVKGTEADVKCHPPPIGVSCSAGFLWHLSSLVGTARPAGEGDVEDGALDTLSPQTSGRAVVRTRRWSSRCRRLERGCCLIERFAVDVAVGLHHLGRDVSDLRLDHPVRQSLLSQRRDGRMPWNSIQRKYFPAMPIFRRPGCTLYYSEAKHFGLRLGVARG